jgi:hypothetical protein
MQNLCGQSISSPLEELQDSSYQQHLDSLLQRKGAPRDSSTIEPWVDQSFGFRMLNYHGNLWLFRNEDDFM